MSRILKSSPPIFDIELHFGSTVERVRVHMFNYSDQDDYWPKRLARAVADSSKYRDINNWCLVFNARLLAMLPAIDDPWIFVKVAYAISRQKVWKHSRDTSRDYIRKTETDGIYQIRQSQLHQYLTPSMVRQHLE
ncbi:MAG TPA: hypothetical protein VM260_09460 [Pirellula sp.]|nr:hypothetical protein [Pirellula sp.]